MQKQFIIYAFVVANVTTTFENKLKSPKFLKSYLYLKKIFDNELARILFEQNYKNYIIDLIENKKSLYISLYNLF